MKLFAEKELKEGETKTRETHLKAVVQDKDGKGCNCGGGNGDKKGNGREISLGPRTLVAEQLEINGEITRCLVCPTESMILISSELRWPERWKG